MNGTYDYSNSTSHASSKIRRTRSLAVTHRNNDDDDSSVSSLGSLPEADYVAQQFGPPKLTRQNTIGSQRPQIRNTADRDNRGRHLANGSQPSPNRCPHCTKTFRNSWAVPKHVSRIHDRARDLHCPKCSFQTRSPAWLQQHEKDAHRRCPFCRHLFVLLNKHVAACPKRRR